MARYAMIIDLDRCLSCQACVIACKMENNVPDSTAETFKNRQMTFRTRVVPLFRNGRYPNPKVDIYPTQCNQCDNPPCVSICPVKATYKRPDGIVEINYNQCIGCRYCLHACPYGARTYDFGEFYTLGTPKVESYEKLPSFEYGQEWPREEKRSPVGNARKCHFCNHRLEAGMLPACVTTCIGYATFFGDANDPESLVSNLISKPNAMRLKEELGTQPKVHYLV